MQDALSDLVRCPSCGASNPAGSAWCGQCHRRFDAGRAGGARGGAVVHAPFGHPSIANRDGVVVWTCPACDGENPIEATSCARCGSNFSAFFAGPKAEPAPRASGGAALAWSAILPGAGHWVYRRAGPAATRALLYLWGLGISILLLARPPSSGRAVVRGVGAIFALAAAGVWLLSMLETMRMRDGDHRWLVPPKALTWVAAGLSVVLLLGLFAAAIAGRR